MKTIRAVIDVNGLVEFNEKREPLWGADINFPFDANDFAWYSHDDPYWQNHPSIIELQTDTSGIEYKFEFLIPTASVASLPMPPQNQVVFKLLNNASTIDPAAWFWGIFNEILGNDVIFDQANGTFILPLENADRIEIGGVTYDVKTGSLTTLPEGMMQLETNIQYSWVFAFEDFANNNETKYCRIDPYLKNRPRKAKN